MAIKINITKDETPVQATMELNIRKTLAGHLMIMDHDDIDIVLLPEQNKIIAFPKDAMSDVIYGTQDRLFYFLEKKGLIEYGSIRSGNVYGSMEAKMAEPVEEGVSSLQTAVYSVGKFIEEEKPYFMTMKAYEEREEQEMMNPDDENSTELGEVPHQAEKGSLRPGWIRGPYGMTTHYRYEE